MKKVIIAIFLFCLALNTYNAFNRNNCIDELKVNDLNSKNLLMYIKENNLEDKIVKVCSANICTTLNGPNLENNIKNFINKNLSYLSGKDEGIALEAELKGFRVERILFNSCL